MLQPILEYLMPYSRRKNMKKQLVVRSKEVIATGVAIGAAFGPVGVAFGAITGGCVVLWALR